MSEHAPVQTVQAPTPQTPMAGGFLMQRKCACGSYGNGGECDKCHEAASNLRRSANSRGVPASIPPIVDDVLNSPGQQLDDRIRSWMEPRFAHDFSHVRLHTDQKAAESAQAVNALAYTIGSNLVFGAGRYEPHTEGGVRLLAHELAHVVQQTGSNATAQQTAKAISDPSDAAEVEAESAVVRVMRGETVSMAQRPNARLHALTGGQTAALVGGIAGGLGAIGLTLYLTGVFDREHFTDQELTEYLTTLATTHRIENTRSLSDNKARDVVRRWTSGNAVFNIDNGFRAAGGSLTGRELKRLLIEEMLEGPTTDSDETAIITILRRSADRQQILAAIGRNRLWDNFSGQNRRIVEAITLTDAEFNDQALVDRLKALPADELADYRDNAVDPAVRARIERILQLQRITTPLDISTPIGAGGIAHPVIPGFDVDVLPDTTTQQEQFRNQANTSIGLNFNPAIPDAFMDSNGIVQSSLVPGNIRITIQTTYGPGTDPSGQSGYGRGTTREDIATGRTSVRFHEGQHGLDYLEFLRNNPPPVFGGQLGMTTQQWDQAREQFRQDCQAYHQRVVQFTLQRTECVGTAISPEIARQYYNNANICRTVGGRP